MNTLTESIVKDLLTEAGMSKKVVVIYAGRFQPFHIGHFSVYQLFVNKFGKDNVFIATSNKVDKPKSPFSFVEKKMIITRMFPVPSSKVVQVKNPYSPVEILKDYDSSTTAYIAAVSEKDGTRLGGKYYKPFNANMELHGYREEGYYIVAPEFSKKFDGVNISGTMIRMLFGGGDKENRSKMFKAIYGKWDERIFDLISGRLQEAYEAEKLLIEYLDTCFATTLKEASGNTSAGPDDGPNYFYGNFVSYKNITARRAELVGYKVLDYIIDSELELSPTWAIYPDGPVGDVSFAPTGVAALGVGNERREHTHLEGIGAFSAWDEHVSRMAKIIGYDIVDYLDARRVIEDVSSQAYDELIKKTTERIRDIVTHVEELSNTEPLNEQLLKEGGAYGHMAHVFEDMDLTFGDLKNLIDLSLQGKLDVESGITEKLDGLALSVSWKNGKLIAARNRGQLRNFGDSALDILGMKQMFSGRGELSDAFLFAMEDLESAISKLSSDQRSKIFDEGRKFMAVEIIYPATQNVIPYGLNLLVFHGTTEYDQGGNPIGTGSKGDSGVLVNMIKSVNANVQKTFTLSEPQVISIPKSQEYSSRKTYYLNRISSLQRRFKLKDSDTVMMWHQLWWEEHIQKEANKTKYALPNHILMGMVRRWAFLDRSYNINTIKQQIDNDAFLKTVLEFDKKDHKNQFDENIWNFESIFLELGAEILRNASGFISASPDKTIQSIRKDVEKAVSELQSSKDIKKLDVLKKHLTKLNSVGGMESIVPSEGIVFSYKGKTYKITGTFAPINKILWALKS